MKQLEYIVAAGLLLGLSSCGVYRKYERPAQSLAGIDSLYRPENRPDTTRSIGFLRWKELFTDTDTGSKHRDGQGGDIIHISTSFSSSGDYVVRTIIAIFTARIIYALL